MFRNVLIVLGPIFGMVLLLTLLLPSEDDKDSDNQVVSFSYSDDDDAPEPPQPPQPPEPFADSDSTPDIPKAIEVRLEKAQAKLEKAHALQGVEDWIETMAEKLEEGIEEGLEGKDGWAAELRGGNVVLVAGTSQNTTRTCNGETKVVVLGNSNNVTLAGECEAVAVTGNSNRVKIETTQKLAMLGNSNTGLADKVATVYLRGNSNSIRYKSGLDGVEPKLDAEGNGNAIRRATDEEG